MEYQTVRPNIKGVAPPVGAWIEIGMCHSSSETHEVAPPVGAWIEIQIVLCGECEYYRVAPPVGAWIEIQHDYACGNRSVVAPPVGAWIEIAQYDHCRLKYIVAPPVGAWIEIRHIRNFIHVGTGRSPRGSVD